MDIIKKLCVFVLILNMTFLCFSEEEKRQAKIISVDGELSIKLNRDTDWEKAIIGTIVPEGAILKTRANSLAIINVDGKGQTATIEMKEDTELLFLKLTQNKNINREETLLDLALGQISIKANKFHGEDTKFEIKTPTSIIAAEGSRFSVKVEAVN